MRYFKKIIGEKIYLSPINKDDVEIYTKWVNDSEITGYIGLTRRVISVSGEQKVLEELSKGYTFAIVKNDDTLIGNIGLFDIENIDRKATLGLFIGDAENRGKGYGAEALRLIIGYGFNTLNLHNIMLLVHSDNERGLACYKKVGFKEFGRRRESVFKNGQYFDEIYMEVLASEFANITYTKAGHYE